ncbi:hypothetical protein [Pseudanabaena sp. PCC 6802]|uniref:hypothetical protein n=1 Tax=Pseudanabaena sp. PCC 6802 TaxID=118173 RepID=UPI00034D12A6|nr:hypothetical protein [Pseudanabaena sp. PCC 6802]
MQNSMRNITGIGVGLFLILFATPSAIFGTGMSQEMDARSSLRSHQSSPPLNQFRRIEQPLALKIAVTVGGVALISAQLWWFLGGKQLFGKESKET